MNAGKQAFEAWLDEPYGGTRRTRRTWFGPGDGDIELLRAGFQAGFSSAIATPAQRQPVPTQCTCGVPWALGVVHRAKAPCFIYLEPPAPQQPVADRSAEPVALSTLTTGTVEQERPMTFEDRLRDLEEEDQMFEDRDMGDS